MPDDCVGVVLQKDVIDFMNLVEYKISIIKPKVNELINLIQNSVEKSLGKEYEVKLYGSHATGLCLPWSDIDVVLCKKNTNQNDNLYCNKYMPLHDLFTYLQKNNDFKSINYIGATSVPLIKIKTPFALIISVIKYKYSIFCSFERFSNIRSKKFSKK